MSTLIVILISGSSVERCTLPVAIASERADVR